MQNRMEKYYHDDEKPISRSEKHIDVYKQLYGANLESYESLPVESNANEIDITTFLELTTRGEYQKEKYTQKYAEDIVEQDKKKEEENRIFDINELIEKAHNEREKLVQVQEKITNYNYLNTLNSNIKKDEIEKEIQNELNDLNKKVADSKIDNNLSLDILEDLKPNSNTVVTDPIKESDNITDSITKQKEAKEFFTGTVDFGNDDFSDIEEIEKEKKNTVFIIAIIILVLVIVGLTVWYIIRNI